MTAHTQSIDIGVGTDADVDVDVDVVVVGGGPGGAATAQLLAQRGRQVLVLDRQCFPRDKSCGDGLTRRAMRTLDAMGVVDQLQATSPDIVGVRAVMRGRGAEVLDYPDDGGLPGRVVPRLILDDLLLRAAIDAGAECWQGATVEQLIEHEGVVHGVQGHRDGQEFRVTARATVVAAGSGTRLAVRRETKEGMFARGFAIRTYLDDVQDFDNRLELHLPIRDVTDRHVLPSYGWIFPLAAGRANFGIGLFEKVHDANLRALGEAFLERCRTHDPRLANATVAAPWRAAPLQFDFAPEHCARPGLALVGDAAGLVSPFTGEGISYALESGRLAADVIDRRLRFGAGPLALDDYATLLGRKYLGYFEAGQRSARRYRLVWHMLDDTFGRTEPLFALSRRVMLFPEGIGDVHPTHVLDDVRRQVSTGLPVREHLLSVGDTLMSQLRTEWPFLGPSWHGSRGDPGVPLRPALFTLLSAYAGGSHQTNTAVNKAAAALELGHMAAMAQLSVSDSSDSSDSDGPRERMTTRANWGDKVAVVAADFLMARASALASDVDSEVSRLVADGIAQTCHGRFAELAHIGVFGITEERHLTALAAATGPVLSVPCHVGALLGGATTAVVDALTTYGHHVAVAYRLVDEARQLEGNGTDITRHDLRRGVFGLGIVRALEHSGVADDLKKALRERPLSDNAIDRVSELIVGSGVLASVYETAQKQIEQAIAALEPLEAGAVRTSLTALARYSVRRSASMAAS